MLNSSFIHERDIVNKDHGAQNEEVNLIASHLVWDEDHDPNNDIDAEDPQIGIINNVWVDPLDPHPMPPRVRFDPNLDYAPKVMVNHLQYYLGQLVLYNMILICFTYDSCRCLNQAISNSAADLVPTRRN
jgi:hypothetical protein